MKNKIYKTKITRKGLFSKWSNRCKELPRFLKYTDTIPCRVEAEFGYILEITKGKGKRVNYIVKHPNFRDEFGNIEENFSGEILVKKDSFKIYLGDTIWEPINDKIGVWRFIAKIDNEVVADESFNIVSDVNLYKGLIDEHALDHLGNL